MDYKDGEICRLRECLKRAGLYAFMNGTPEEVADHLKKVADSWTKEIATLKEERDRYKEALELARGFLINLALGVINQALGKEEE
jgi:hypothetical protein